MNERSGRRLRRWRNNLAIHSPSERGREREGERESEINAVTPQCRHMLFHFLPSARREVSRRGYRVRLRETWHAVPRSRSAHDGCHGSHEGGTGEFQWPSNDRTTPAINRAPTLISTRLPAAPLFSSFLVFFFSSSSSSSCFFSSYSMNEPRTRWGNSLYRGRLGEGVGNVCRRLIKRHRSLGRVRSCFCYAIDWKMPCSSDRGFPEMLQGHTVSIFAQRSVSGWFIFLGWSSVILIQMISNTNIGILNLSRESVDWIFIRI